MADVTLPGPVVAEPTTPVLGDEVMAQENYEPGNLQVAMTVLGNEFGAAAGRRVNGADQLAADSQRMWTIAMTTPTVLAAQGVRLMSESGSGRTRVEANTPAGGQTVGA